MSLLAARISCPAGLSPASLDRLPPSSPVMASPGVPRPPCHSPQGPPATQPRKTLCPDRPRPLPSRLSPPPYALRLRLRLHLWPSGVRRLAVLQPLSLRVSSQECCAVDCRDEAGADPDRAFSNRPPCAM
ncbi:hypothetical protein BS50DRAFT_217253 [Corynespora cassiicola Philippines]|uniref:Uncharacterized protein n=1 Tax=Corynespora cassiicola Philippines TaxID=1448308 RepID=A0A2T2N3Q6_CORCC|nr:hypothetical protein BS50DRAFT_217253 [Corynespora cassiicola Philippines]